MSGRRQRGDAQRLSLVGASISRQAREPAADVLGRVPRVEERTVAFDFQNNGDVPLQVWASRRAYDYDSATHILTLYLTEQTPPPPPGIVMISNHPRTPAQVEIPTQSRGTIKVGVPRVMRRRVPGEGLGMHVVEELIEQIDRIDLHVQFATEPILPAVEESPDQHRERLRSQGTVLHATITPVGEKEQ